MFTIQKIGRYFIGVAVGMYVLVLTSLESLGRDETFKSLESLVRLWPTSSQILTFNF